MSTSAVIAPGLFQVLFMFLFGGGAGVPLGIPPAAADPAMARIAPRECLFYLTWSGLAAPDARSRNQTEQLLAEKEVAQSLKLLDEQLVAGLRVATAGDADAAAVVDDIHLVAKTVLTSPAAIYISKIEPSTSGEPNVRGGAMVNLGQQASEIARSLSRIEARLPSNRAAKPAGDSSWHRIPLGMNHGGELAPIVSWAVKDQYLIVGLGDGEAEKIVERAHAEPPAWLSELRRQVTVPRPASLLYVNVRAIEKLASAGSPELPKILDGLGLTQLQSVASATGLDETGCVTRTQLAIDGEMKGLLTFFAGQPLTPEHLAPIPKDATLAIAARLNAAKLYQELLDTAGRLEPRSQQELQGGVHQFEETFKLKLREDILQSLGDAWRVYTAPSEGNLVITGLTAVVDIQDHDRLVAANSKLVFSSLFGGLAKGLSETASGQPLGPPRSGRPGPMIRQIRSGKQTIFYLTQPGEFMPFSPAWCITDKELVMALFPQNVNAYLERRSQSTLPTLADVAAVAGPFAAAKPMAVSYVDTQAAFKLVYPMIQVALSIAVNESSRGGPGIDISLLPPAPSIGRHLLPSMTTVSRTMEGVLVETHQTLPLGGVGGLMVLPSMMYFAAPMPLRINTLPTQQAIATNNMKMLGLALFNYETVHGGFPPAAAGQKPNQPPVSWRVLVLPYLDETPLYQQYHFDEPWDSENNKRLIPRMPNVYKAPGSSKSGAGKTNYLAVVGEPYALSADKERRLAEITDGTSNTIMLVEASDVRAVPWTKPDDFTPDKTKPISGLVGLRRGNFLAAAADCAIHVVPAGIPADTLNSLFTRAGGEPVQFPEPDAVPTVTEPAAPAKPE